MWEINEVINRKRPIIGILRRKEMSARISAAGRTLSAGVSDEPSPPLTRTL